MKNKAITILFAGALLAGLLLHIVLPDAALSYSERRKLAQRPAFSFETVMSGTWMDDIEAYLLDQFPARDAFRSVKANTHFYVFRQKDNNGIYLAQDGHILKMDYPFSEASVENFAKKLKSIYDAHLKGNAVYYAIIPDKSEYTHVSEDHLRTPYQAQIACLQQYMHDAPLQYIELVDCLTLEEYYKTDLHWRQESLGRVRERLEEAMGFDAAMADVQVQAYTPFYGAYHGQSALKNAPDTLRYMTSPLLSAAYVEDLEHPDMHQVYAPEALGGMDSYDVYLSGATPLTKITNSKADNGRRLVIFRDSFGSSLAPLLVPAYEEIVLVDLRYMSSSLLADYVDFTDAEVLFLYGELMLNNAALLK